MFLGRYYHTLETHGRVSLPKKFRSQTKIWIITRGLDGGLFLFPEQTFTAKLAELAERTFTYKAHRDFIRLMTNEAMEVKADANGRVQLPEYLINLAELSKDLVIAGSYDWVEIWDRQRYHQYLDQIQPQAEEIAESLSYAR